MSTAVEREARIADALQRRVHRSSRACGVVIVERVWRFFCSVRAAVFEIVFLAAARARGRKGGRPKKLTDPKQLALARTLYDGGQTDIATICETLGISRATLYRALKDRRPT